MGVLAGEHGNYFVYIRESFTMIVCISNTEPNLAPKILIKKSQETQCKHYTFIYMQVACTDGDVQEAFHKVFEITIINFFTLQSFECQK